MNGRAVGSHYIGLTVKELGESGGWGFFSTKALDATLNKSVANSQN